MLRRVLYAWTPHGWGGQKQWCRNGQLLLELEFLPVGIFSISSPSREKVLNEVKTPSTKFYWFILHSLILVVTLWSSPISSHLNRFLFLHCLICPSSQGNGQLSEEASQTRSCYFAHQSGGSSLSSSLYLRRCGFCGITCRMFYAEIYYCVKF